MVGIREAFWRKTPLIRIPYILKGDIRVAEKKIPQLKSLLKRLKLGERPSYVKIGNTGWLYPQAKHVERDLKRYQESLPRLRKQESLPRLRKWLRIAQKKKKLKKVL